MDRREAVPWMFLKRTSTWSPFIRPKDEAPAAAPQEPRKPR